MTRVAVTLYDHPDNATDVLNGLREAGFDEAQMECIEPEPTTNRYSRRLTGSDGSQSLEPDQVLELLNKVGISDEDAHHYLDEIRRGRSLVAVRAEEEISGRARQVMNRYPLEESKETSTLDTPPEQAPHPGAMTTGQVGRSRRRRRSAGSQTEIFRVPDREPETKPVAASTTERRPPRREEHREGELDVGDLSAPSTTEGFKLYRPDFVRHYEEHFAAMGDYSFDDYAIAYRWGMVLARDRRYRGEDWSQISERARRLWNRKMTGRPWEQFREAVRFGWYIIRGDRELYGRRPRGR